MTWTRRKWLTNAGLSLAGITLAPKISSANTIAHSTSNSPKKIADKIILTSNENPYGPSPLARKAMKEVIDAANRYPWANTTALREKIAGKHNLLKEHVLIGAGSSEILGLIGTLVANQKLHLITAENTFSIWRNAAVNMGASLTKVNLTADKKHDLPAMEKAIQSNTKLIYICNPNNPTGTVVNSNELTLFIERCSKNQIIVIDEAYLEYTNEPSMTPLVAHNKNVIVVKTFSKLYGLAGARIGYALAHPDTIKILQDMQPWANAGASTTAIAAASASFDDTSFMHDVQQKNYEVKQFMYEQFELLNIPYIVSYANFIYFQLPNYTGDLVKAMEAKNILCNGKREEKSNWYRITIGTMQEMKVYIDALKSILSNA